MALAASNTQFESQPTEQNIGKLLPVGEVTANYFLLQQSIFGLGAKSTIDDLVTGVADVIKDSPVEKRAQDAIEMIDTIVSTIMKQREIDMPDFGVKFGAEYIKKSLSFDVPLWEQVTNPCFSFKARIAATGEKPTKLALINSADVTISDEFYKAVAGQFTCYMLLEQLIHRSRDPIVKSMRASHMAEVDGFTHIKYTIGYTLMMAIANVGALYSTLTMLTNGRISFWLVFSLIASLFFIRIGWVQNAQLKQSKLQIGSQKETLLSYAFSFNAVLIAAINLLCAYFS